MRLIKLALLIAAVTLFIVACNSAPNTNQTANTNAQKTPAASPTAAANTATAPSPTDELAAVRPVYAESCARCHKLDGEGGTVEVLGKKLKVPSLKVGHALKHTDAEFAKQISEGGDGMPAFKEKLKPEQINDLVRFIRKEFQSGAVATPDKVSPTVPKI
jgi:mono/diheme cytochrome c family protein